MTVGVYAFFPSFAAPLSLQNGLSRPAVTRTNWRCENPPLSLQVGGKYRTTEGFA
jgi:hypothetical protein